MKCLGTLLISTVFVVLFGLVLCVVYIIICEIQLSKQLPVEVKSRLISMAYSPSTRKTSAVPVFGMNGQMSIAVCSSGCSASTVTIWECGEYGRLSTCNKDVFRLARDESVLLIKSNWYDTRIVGIK